MIIGISGKIKSGKDTVAKMIQGINCSFDKDQIIYHSQREGFSESSWEIKKFAHKVKQVAAVILGFDVKSFENQDFKKLTLSELTGQDWSILVPRVEGGTPKVIREITVRELLQKIGTEFGREMIHPNIWVLALFSEYKPYNAKGDSNWEEESNWLIPDTRFPNEVKAIKERNGIVIRVNRALLPPTKLSDGSVIQSTRDPYNEHPSETALDNYNDFDYVIDNNGSLEDLFVKVKNIYEQIIQKNSNS